MPITYALEPNLSVNDFVHTLKASGMGRQRPIHDRPHLERVLKGSDIVMVARDGSGLIVGLARSMTDFAACCYCADLAVDQAWQRQGIGRRLIEETLRSVPEVMTLQLFANETARGFYEKLGFVGDANAYAVVARTMR